MAKPPSALPLPSKETVEAAIRLVPFVRLPTPTELEMMRSAGAVLRSLGVLPPPETEPVKPAAAEKKRNKGGRPRGSGYEAADEPLVREMLQAVRQGERLNLELAKKFAKRAKGGGTLKSKAKRLLGRLEKPQKNR